jgi:hypothetical protein
MSDRQAQPDADRERYDRISARAGSANLKASRAGRDVAPDRPPVRDPARRARALEDLEYFLRSYFPGTFRKAWSRDQLAMVERLQSVVTDGGQMAVAAPRGNGKTSIFERAALWGVLAGRRRFIVVVAATDRHAGQCLGRVKAELEFNDLLLEDFPLACWPIRKLESQSRRCVGQLWDGRRTCVVWDRNRVVLPSVPGSEASGAILHVAGITSAVRGLSHVTPDGRTIRPDLVLIDDPSTRESAASFVQNAQRLEIVQGDLAGLAGPGESIAQLAAVTVIHRGDLADQLLDRSRYPEWKGERFKLVYEWPTRADLWLEYEQLRREGLKAGDDGAEATAFYATHRREMDAGAVVGWPERYEPGELSAIQHAYNLKIRLGPGFDAEYQNEPAARVEETAALDPAAVAARCGGIERGTAPPECETLVGYVDCGADCLWWLVGAFDSAFTCNVVDYGAWPEQSAEVFLARQASPNLAQAYPDAGGVDGQLYAALEALAGHLFARPWRRTDGADLPLSWLLVDSGWMTETVRLFARRSRHRDRLQIAKGVGFTASATPVGEFRPRPGERKGDSWILGVAGTDRLRLLKMDTNLWKSRAADMLRRPLGMKGGVILPGDRPAEHELLAVHCSAEFPTRVEARGNAVDVWDRRPSVENHLWDCLVGTLVAASFAGLSPLATVAPPEPPRRRRRLTFSEMQAEARARKPPPKPREWTGLDPRGWGGLR